MILADFIARDGLYNYTSIDSALAIKGMWLVGMLLMVNFALCPVLLTYLDM